MKPLFDARGGTGKKHRHTPKMHWECEYLRRLDDEAVDYSPEKLAELIEKVLGS